MLDYPISAIYFSVAILYDIELLPCEQNENKHLVAIHYFRDDSRFGTF